MRCTPIASASVTVGSNPSGTKATIMPRPKIKLSARFMPAMATARKKKRTPMATAMTVTIRVTTAISFCNGLSSSPKLWVRLAILPNSVRIPVA